ncbi:MAG: tetratricopeptide repeat protein [Verrucomicrobia bacterium]|nr:tetratricopeptide repeat protein [Verrucomicrobiota bacterium]
MLTLFSAAAALALEILSVKALLSPQPITGEVLLLHWLAVAAALPALAALFPAGHREGGVTFVALVAGFAAAAPVLGFLIVLGWRGVLELRVSKGKNKDLVLGTREYLTEPEEEELEPVTPQSLLQILQGATPQARRDAILALRDVEPKKALPLLQKAIQDSDEQVRLMAQTQFNLILAGVEGAIKTLEAGISAGARPIAKLVQLAEQYHELVYLGLSTDETMRLHLQRAVELLNEAGEKAPNNSNVLFLLLRCHLRLGDAPKAKAVLKAVKSRGLGGAFTHGWEAEICFLERDWTGLAVSLRRLESARDTPAPLREMADFWLTPASTKAGA